MTIRKYNVLNSNNQIFAHEKLIGRFRTKMHTIGFSDNAKVSAEMKAYQPIPVIADFSNEDGSDSLRDTIEANCRQVKQEKLSLVDSETARIKADPALAHLVKE